MSGSIKDNWFFLGIELLEWHMNTGFYCFLRYLDVLFNKILINNMWERPAGVFISVFTENDTEDEVVKLVAQGHMSSEWH